MAAKNHRLSWHCRFNFFFFKKKRRKRRTRHRVFTSFIIHCDFEDFTSTTLARKNWDGRTHVAQARDLSSMHAPMFGLRGCLNFFGQGSNLRNSKILFVHDSPSAPAGGWCFNQNGIYSLKWRLTDRYLRWGTLADPRPGRGHADQCKSNEFVHELPISGFPRFWVSPTCFRAK